MPSQGAERLRVEFTPFRGAEDAERRVSEDPIDPLVESQRNDCGLSPIGLASPFRCDWNSEKNASLTEPRTSLTASEMSFALYDEPAGISRRHFPMSELSMELTLEGRVWAVSPALRRALAGASESSVTVVGRSILEEGQSVAVDRCRWKIARTSAGILR